MRKAFGETGELRASWALLRLSKMPTAVKKQTLFMILYIFLYDKKKVKKLLEYRFHAFQIVCVLAHLSL